MARSIIAEVEAEYGEPFWDVVRGFAADNYGCDTTARILGYKKPNSFRELIARHKQVIAWPKQGSCNVQRERGTYSAERTEKSLAKRMNSDKSKVAQYKALTGESVFDLLERVKFTHTITDVAHLLGYCEASPFRSWLNVRGLKPEFKKTDHQPPKGMGWQSDRCKMVERSRFTIYAERQKAREQSPATL